MVTLDAKHGLHMPLETISDAHPSEKQDETSADFDILLFMAGTSGHESLVLKDARFKYIVNQLYVVVNSVLNISVQEFPLLYICPVFCSCKAC